MLCLKKLSCPLGTKWKINVFLFLILITLALLTLSYVVLFPLKLVSTDFRIYNMFLILSRKAQAHESVTEDYPSLNETLVLNISDSHARTSLPEGSTTEDYLPAGRPTRDPLPAGMPTAESLATGSPTGETPKTLHVYEYLINEPDKCREDVPFLLFLLTVEAWQKEARQAIRQTWGKEDFLPGVKILRLFFLGKTAKWTQDNQQSLLTESQQYHDIIQQDYLDTYWNLTIKVLMGLHWASTYCPKATYIMKTDSDMFVNTEYLIKSVLKPDQPPRKDFFTGYLMINASPIRNLDSKWYVTPEEYPELSYPPFCSGTGYVFSGDLPSKIVRISPNIRWLHLEDVYIGLCLNRLGVEPVAPPRDSDFNPWRVGYSDCGYNHIVTSHQLRPGEIIYYWNRVQQNKHNCG
ncbi:beta-1,3-galactosyltransferase 2-like isoform X2 [Hyperolius riggenbachi]